MNKEQINELLNKEKKAELVNIFEYKGKKYIKGFKIDEKDLIYVYFEIDENQNIKDIEDEKIVRKLKQIKELHEKIIY